MDCPAWITDLKKSFSITEAAEKLYTQTIAHHRCRYCNIADPQCVVECDKCHKWFCNGHSSSGRSHIVTHLSQAVHNGVKLHPNGPVGDVPVKCSRCGCSNVFLLGYMGDEAGAKTEFLCRLPCALDSKIIDDNQNIEVGQWHPVIEERYIVEWLVKVSPVHGNKITRNQMSSFEKLWKSDNDASTLDELSNMVPEEYVPTVSIRYESAYFYRDTFLPLVQLEADYDKNSKERVIHESVKVSWKMDPDGRCRGFFLVTGDSIGDSRITLGRNLFFKYLGEDKSWEGIGCVYKTPQLYNPEVGVVLDGSCDLPPDCSDNFTISYFWNQATFLRMQSALREFASGNCSLSVYIYRLILGHPVENVIYRCSLPSSLSAPNLPPLNSSQAYAVKSALQCYICLIQGPPGTGKTVTSASVVYHLFHQQKGQVLVCAPSNVAVDHLTDKIKKTGLKVIRVFARSREEVETSTSEIALHKLVFEEINKDPILSNLHKLKIEGRLTPADDEQLQNAISSAERTLLQHADVICCTCSGAGDVRLLGMEFHSLLIDECTQATEPECLIPLVKGIQQLILVGDHRQLRPAVFCQQVASAGYESTLFERFICLELQPVQLSQQYRMHPQLSRFPSKLFYDGKLKDGVSAEERTLKNLCNFWPHPEKPLLFYSVTGLEETSGNGVSFLNILEAVLVEEILVRWLDAGVEANQIGIITPYIGQKTYLQQHLQCSKTISMDTCQDLEIACVDGFQGREKDFIIFSCVRSNKKQIVGFLSDPRRLNVALTRARYGLVILGNAQLLGKQPLWNHLLQYYKKHNLLMEGPLSNMQHCSIKLGKAQPLTNAHNPGAHFMSNVMFAL